MPGQQRELRIAQPDGNGDIGGVVTSSNGPEAGVWVIAETTDFETKFRKIVVTNDQGQYLLPELPKASYKIWVRGYGLVDSEPVVSTPGKTLALSAVIAPSAQAAAEYYPADYWASLLNIPSKSAFPMTVSTSPSAGRQLRIGGFRAARTTVIQTQAEWLYRFKGCWTCHQMGTKSTRELPANLGTFPTSAQAWERALSAGTVGRQTVATLNPSGTTRDWRYMPTGATGLRAVSFRLCRPGQRELNGTSW